MTSYQKDILSTWLFLFLILSSAFSYASNPNIQKFTYLTALLPLVGLLFLWPIVSINRLALVGIFCGLMLIFTLLPFSMSGFPANEWLIIQSLGYPIVAFLTLIVGWRITLSRARPLIYGVIIIGIANAAVGLMASLGYLSSLPLIGDIEIGRVIFGTPLPSSSGLFNNVNYYSTVQGLCFWFYLWMAKITRARLSSTDKTILIFLFSTSFIGSSRGVVIALLSSLFIYFLISLLEVNVRAKIVRLAVILVCLVIAGSIVASHYEVIYEIFRVSKGLNNRDVIWSTVYDLWLTNPMIGYGNIEVIGQYIESSTGTNSSIQSAYLMTLMRGGILLFISTYGLIVACVIFGLGKSKNLWVEQKVPVAILTYWLISMSVRTFSLGGMGFLPVIGGIALSSILYAKNISYFRKINFEKHIGSFCKTVYARN